MPRIKDEHRKRLFRPKNKTGCVTCKKRHVRCDETRPSCIQCTSRGRVCGGYEVEPPGSQPLRMEINTSASVFESRNEHRSFAYFQQRTSEHLAGLLESQYWNELLLQVARSDSSVRHALVALAAVHEDYEQMREADVQTNEFALRQYNCAIRSHVERSKSAEAMTTKDVMSYLVSCTIFICIEMLQRHPGSAIVLIKQAVKMFYSLPTTGIEATCSMWSMELFEAILGRFQSMAVALIGRAAYSGTEPPRIKASTLRPMPIQFSSIREAKEYLEFYLNMHELSRRPSSTGYINDPAERDRQTRAAVAAYYSLINRWSSAFDALKLHLGDEAALNERDRRTLVVLDIRRKFLTTLANLNTWDDCKQTFNEVLDLVESIMQSLDSAAPFADAKQPRLFTLEVGTVSPLFMVARGCRDPALRRRAIRLLRKVPIREGLWDSVAAADIAERVMQLEEGAVGHEIRSAGDVPTWARIPEAARSFDIANMRMVIRFSRKGGGGESQIDRPAEYEEYVAM